MSDPAAGLRLELEPPLAWMILDRDERRNAVSVPMLEAMTAFVELVAGRADIRALLLAGEGHGFCAGEDVRGFQFADHAAAARFVRKPLGLFTALERLPKPFLVAAHGFALGFGSEVLLVADSVHAHPDTVFGFAEIDHGAVPSVLVTRGLDVAFRRRALDLALTGRRIGIEEALDARLAHEVCDDPRAAARAAALEMAGWAPAAVAVVKRQLGRRAHADHSRAAEFMPAVMTQVRAAI